MGRPRQLLMTRFLGRHGSASSLEDKATLCALEHVRKPSLDASSIASDVTQQSERSLPQFMFESERSCGNESMGPVSRRVGFDKVEIRQYEQVIGDHPHCSSGCPLSLGWDYVQEESESVSDYEENKQQHGHIRKAEELRLSDQERHDRLLANEVSDTEIRRSLRRLHRERECSLKCQMKAKAQFFM